MRAFDHLKWIYDGAFKQLFGLGRGDVNKHFPKIQMPGVLPGGDVEVRFDWYITWIDCTIPIFFCKYLVL